MTAPVTTRPPVPHRVASTLFALALPLAVVGAGLLLTWSWAHELPDPVAVHWGADGAADGFGSVTSQLVVLAVTVTLLSAAAWALAFWLGRDASTRSLATGTSLGLAVFLTVLVVGGLAAQRGLDDAADVGPLGGTIGLAVGAGLVAGALVAFAQPGDPARPATGAVPADAERLPLGPGERAAWTRTATGSAAVAIGGGATAVVAGLALALDLPGLWLLVLALGALLAATAVFRVRVDGTGLTVRSALGWPRLHVPADEVVAARTTRVRPLGDFGGWGYRVGAGGRTGVVLRSGGALEVERTGGRVFVVTVDDAGTAAALLNTFADRDRGRTDR